MGRAKGSKNITFAELGINEGDILIYDDKENKIIVNASIKKNKQGIICNNIFYGLNEFCKKHNIIGKRSTDYFFTEDGKRLSAIYNCMKEYNLNDDKIDCNIEKREIEINNNKEITKDDIIKWIDEHCTPKITKDDVLNAIINGDISLSDIKDIYIELTDKHFNYGK